jgi:glycosyltransferase involved in cell wall biosynthesis
MVGTTGIQLADSLSYGVRQTLRLVESLSWDLHIGHQEVGCWTSFTLGRRGRRVAADFEDWYSRDLLPEAQRSRPLRLLREVEHWLLHSASYVSTTSQAMALAMHAASGGRVPEVVYNVFPWEDRQSLDKLTMDRVDKSKPSLHWVSKVIGPGRGLELLLDALKSVATPVEVHLRGAHSQQTAAELRGRFPAIHGHQLFLHGPCPAKQLLSRIAEHDIGLALELNQPASRDLTVTYKFFHYLVAGLAVVATNTAGQMEIAASIPDAVLLADQNDPHDLGAKISELVNSKQRLVAAKAAALAGAESRFCWERQATLVVESVERVLRANLNTPR